MARPLSLHDPGGETQWKSRRQRVCFNWDYDTAASRCSRSTPKRARRSVGRGVAHRLEHRRRSGRPDADRTSRFCRCSHPVLEKIGARGSRAALSQPGPQPVAVFARRAGRADLRPRASSRTCRRSSRSSMPPPRSWTRPATSSYNAGSFREIPLSPTRSPRRCAPCSSSR